MPPKPNRNRQILIYAGVAGAVLAIVVLLKRKGSSTPAAEQPSTTYASAPGSIPAVGETGESNAVRGELSAFENQLTTQLPAAIQSGVEAGAQNNRTGGSALAEVGQLVGVLGEYRKSLTGEQVGSGSSNSPSQGNPPATPAPAPVITVNVPPPPSSGSTAPAPTPAKGSSGCPAAFPKSGPKGCYHDGKCGNGCAGHFYQSGAVECQTKSKSGACSW